MSVSHSVRGGEDMVIREQAWTGGDAVDLQNALRASNLAFAGEVGVDQTTVARWHARPELTLRLKTQRLLDKALSRADDEVQQRFSQLQANRRTPPDTSAAAAAAAPVPADEIGPDCGWPGAWTSAAALRAARIVLDADPMQRRDFLALVGAQLTVPAHHWLLARPADEHSAAGGSRVLPDTVDEIDGITAALRRMDDQLGSGTLLDVVDAHLRTVIGLLEHRSYDTSTGRRLHSSAAEGLRLAGWLAFDSGHHGLAQRYWHAALRTAHAAGDRATAANVLGFMSCQAKDLGAAGEAITLAESARTGYPGASPRVTAILHLRAAEAYATAGQERDTRAAIDAAFHSLDRPAAADPSWSYWCTSTHADAQAGFCFLQLGRHDEARLHLTRALAAAAGREGSLQHTLLAGSYLHGPDHDVEQALAHAHQAIDLLTDQVTSTRCRAHLAGVIDGFAEHRGAPGVGELVDRVQQLRAATPW